MDILSLVWYFLAATIVIWVVGKMGLGLTVEGFGAAAMAAIVIAVVTWVVVWGLGLLSITIGGGFMGAIVAIVISALILLVSDKFIPGMKVNGFGGAIVGALAIGVVSWLLAWVFSFFA